MKGRPVFVFAFPGDAVDIIHVSMYYNSISRAIGSHTMWFVWNKVSRQYEIGWICHPIRGHGPRRGELSWTAVTPSPFPGSITQPTLLLPFSFLPYFHGPLYLRLSLYFRYSLSTLFSLESLYNYLVLVLVIQAINTVVSTCLLKISLDIFNSRKFVAYNYNSC